MYPLLLLPTFCPFAVHTANTETVVKQCIVKKYYRTFAYEELAVEGLKNHREAGPWEGEGCAGGAKHLPKLAKMFTFYSKMGKTLCFVGE